MLVLDLLFTPAPCIHVENYFALLYGPLLRQDAVRNLRSAAVDIVLLWLKLRPMVYAVVRGLFLIIHLEQQVVSMELVRKHVSTLLSGPRATTRATII